LEPVDPARARHSQFLARHSQFHSQFLALTRPDVALNQAVLSHHERS